MICRVECCKYKAFANITGYAGYKIGLPAPAFHSYRLSVCKSETAGICGMNLQEICTYSLQLVDFACDRLGMPMFEHPPRCQGQRVVVVNLFHRWFLFVQVNQCTAVRPAVKIDAGIMISNEWILTRYITPAGSGVILIGTWPEYPRLVLQSFVRDSPEVVIGVFGNEAPFIPDIGLCPVRKQIRIAQPVGKVNQDLKRHLTRGEPGLAAWFRRWARLEKVAESLCIYENRLVPGLLQTEAYMRALCENDVPPMSDHDLEATVTARLERQRVLSERPRTAFDFIVEESVFLRPLGGVDVMRDQLDFVLAIAQPRNVTLQIMPSASKYHACLAGPTQLLETPEGRWLAYSEGQENGRLISDPKVVSKLHMRYARLRSQALPPQESMGLLEQMRGAL
jgi:hypothetical protein